MPAIHALCTYHNYVQLQLLHYEQLCLNHKQIRYCGSGYYAQSKTFLHFGLRIHVLHSFVAAEIH